MVDAAEHVVSAGVNLAVDHPVEAIGLGLGAVSIATGVGAAFGAVEIGDVSLTGQALGTASALTGGAAAGIDLRACLANPSFAGTSCYGAAAGGIGTALSVGGLLVEGGVIDASESLGKALDWGAPALGGVGFGADSYGTLSGTDRDAPPCAIRGGAWG